MFKSDKVVFVHLTLRQLKLYNDLWKQFGLILGLTKCRESPADLDHNCLIHSFFSNRMIWNKIVSQQKIWKIIFHLFPRFVQSQSTATFNGFVVQQPMNTLIKVGRCPGWSESSLNAQPFLWFCLHSLIHFYGTLGLNNARDRKTNSVDIDKKLQYASHLGLHCLFVSFSIWQWSKHLTGVCTVWVKRATTSVVCW